MKKILSLILALLGVMVLVGCGGGGGDDDDSDPAYLGIRYLNVNREYVDGTYKTLNIQTNQYTYLWGYNTYTSTNYNDANLTWWSDDTSIASVSSVGKVSTGYNTGTAKIWCKHNDSGEKVWVNFTVNPKSKDTVGKNIDTKKVTEKPNL